MVQAIEVGQAGAFIELKRYQRAVDALLPHLAHAPDDHHALCLLAQAYLGLNDDVKALGAAQNAVRTTPDDEWALRLLSSALMMSGRYHQARDAADRARQADPREWRCHVQRANVDLAFARVDDLSWAAAYRAVELAPDEASTHQVLGRVALAARIPKLAEQQFRAALAIDPDNAVSQNNLAVALMRR